MSTEPNVVKPGQGKDESADGKKGCGMCASGPLPIERQVVIVAGTLVLLGFLIPGMDWFSALVGAGMIFAGVTGHCMITKILLRIPYNKKAAS